jgi:hypothetical protein
MKREDALRKVDLLRQVTRENGFSEGETDNAIRIAGALSHQHAIRPDDVRSARPVLRRLPWFYWQDLLNEFCLELRHFGKRGSVSINGTHLLMIRGDTSEWIAQKMSPRGWEIVERNSGLDALRSYLMRNTPRTYTFFSR